MASDAFTSNWQKELFNSYKMSPTQCMCGVNLFSCLLTSISLIQQGDLFNSLVFMSQYPKFTSDCIILSFCSAAGQLFIYHTIKVFGKFYTLKRVFFFIDWYEVGVNFWADWINRWSHQKMSLFFSQALGLFWTADHILQNSAWLLKFKKKIYFGVQNIFIFMYLYFLCCNLCFDTQKILHNST